MAAPAQIVLIMKTNLSMTQQAAVAFAILMGSSAAGRGEAPTLANGARIPAAPAECRVELVRRVLDAFVLAPPPELPVSWS